MVDSSGVPFIKVRDVVKKFMLGDVELSILKGISFDVYAGEFLMVVGPSGNGKSTLLNMITGIDRPTEGNIHVDGKHINTMSENQLALWRGTQVGIVFQFFQMLPALTLLNNVMLPMELAHKYSAAERRERAERLLEMVGLKDQMNKLPSMVSGGQQQRAAIARAVANDPPLLIGDEPTGNLDPAGAQIIFDLFTDLVKQGKTMMMVTHDMELAAQVPRKIEIVNGYISKDEDRRRAGEWAGM